MKGGRISEWALRALTRPRRLSSSQRPRPWAAEELAAVMRPGDVLLVEGDQRVSQVISFLTTCPWSHAALYLGRLAGGACVSNACRLYGDGAKDLLVEALATEGVVCAPLAKYEKSLVRICRPRALTQDDARLVCEHAASQIGKTYDVDNLLDLARFFLPAGLVPARFRRDALQFGAGKPTEVICSSLIGAAFAHVGYPILPLTARPERRSLASRIARALLGPSASRKLRFQRPPPTLITPRDFDLSPYFEIVKPPAPDAANYRSLAWDVSP